MLFRVLTLSALLAALLACTEQTADDTAAARADDEARVVAEPPAQPTTLPRSASSEGASVFFITPSDGATVSTTVSIEFGINGMDVAKAGDNAPNSGHHHLLIDTGLPELGGPIPADAHHVHFGDGSTATQITLEPGVHTLQMLLGDYLHIPHDPALTSDVITVTVE